MAHIRKSPIAGSWYAGTAEQLKNDLLNCFTSPYGVGISPDQLTPYAQPQQLVGVVVPHAGHRYSGPIASHSYAELYRTYQKTPELIILGPDHRGFSSGFSFYPEGKWETPLGLAIINEQLPSFAQQHFTATADFDSKIHSQEHSIEIQLPFLQLLYGGDVTIAPVMLGRQSLANAKLLAELLFAYKQQHPNLIIVASSDFSHEINYNVLLEHDKQMLKTLQTADTQSADAYRTSVGMTMCGYGPVFTLIEFANKLPGKTVIKVLRYSNSAEITNSPPNNYTVGYASIAVYKSN